MRNNLHSTFLFALLLTFAYCGGGKNTIPEGNINEDNFSAVLKGADLTEPERGVKMRSAGSPDSATPVLEPAAVTFQQAQPGEAYFFVIQKNSQGQFPIAARSLVREEKGSFLSDSREEIGSGIFLHKQAWYSTPAGAESNGKVFCANQTGNIVDCPQGATPTEIVRFDQPLAGKLELKKPVIEKKIQYYAAQFHEGKYLYRKAEENITHEYLGTTLYEDKDTAIIEQKIQVKLFTFTSAINADNTFIDKNIGSAVLSNINLNRKGYILVDTGNIIYMSQTSNAPANAPANLKELQQKFIYPAK